MVRLCPLSVLSRLSYVCHCGGFLVVGGVVSAARLLLGMVVFVLGLADTCLELVLTMSVTIGYPFVTFIVGIREESRPMSGMALLVL